MTATLIAMIAVVAGFLVTVFTPTQRSPEEEGTWALGENAAAAARRRAILSLRSIEAGKRPQRKWV